jgi:predicted MFS family arabinose efflux permease
LTSTPVQPAAAARSRFDGTGFAALDEPSFALFFGGAFISNVGTWLHSVAQSWLVLELTHSASWVGLVAAVANVPTLLFTPLGGVLADRWNRRRWLIVMQLLQLVSAASMGLLVQLGRIQAWHIAVLAVLSGTALAFNGPSFSATIKDLTGPARLPSGVAMIGAQFHLSRALGPFLAAVLLHRIGTVGAFYLNAASFLAVILALALMRPRYPQPREQENETILQSFREGLAYVQNEPRTRWLMLLCALLSLFTFPHLTLLPVLAERVYHIDAAGLGHLTAAAGVGAVLGALSATTLATRVGWVRLTLTSSLITSAALVALSLTTSLRWALVALVIAGWSNVTTATVGLTTVQATVPDRFRGRVMSLYNLAFMGSLTVGSLAAGVLADWTSARFAISAGAVAFALAVVVMAVNRPSLAPVPAVASPPAPEAPSA